MIRNLTVNSFSEYVDIIDGLDLVGYEINLFRGQYQNLPLLPSITRINNQIDTTKTEMEMLHELKRRSKLIARGDLLTDWDWLIYAQHFGMKTRLLDWTSNPLVALWFACYQAPKSNFVYVYVLSGSRNLLVTNAEKSPFEQTSTRILKPILNNERIVAQAGWFTAHMYSARSRKFVPLQSNPEIKSNLFIIKIPYEQIANDSIISRLSIFGVNNQTLFPDIAGVCKHLNWSYKV